ncbi:hypothetical protein [Enterobacter bugandensis]|uniref:hypothetical protein n=1 Tax=Enterobacter bugandensis TaxID=881260 RepID=UPI00066540DA|nr:hypothetical protein [Enterobacter bugandensis]
MKKTVKHIPPSTNDGHVVVFEVKQPELDIGYITSSLQSGAYKWYDDPHDPENKKLSYAAWFEPHRNIPYAAWMMVFDGKVTNYTSAHDDSWAWMSSLYGLNSVGLSVLNPKRNGYYFDQNSYIERNLTNVWVTTPNSKGEVQIQVFERYHADEKQPNGLVSGVVANGRKVTFRVLPEFTDQGRTEKGITDVILQKMGITDENGMVSVSWQTGNIAQYPDPTMAKAHIGHLFISATVEDAPDAEYIIAVDFKLLDDYSYTYTKADSSVQTVFVGQQPEPTIIHLINRGGKDELPGRQIEISEFSDLDNTSVVLSPTPLVTGGGLAQLEYTVPKDTGVVTFEAGIVDRILQTLVVLPLNLSDMLMITNTGVHRSVGKFVAPLLLDISDTTSFNHKSTVANAVKQLNISVEDDGGTGLRLSQDRVSYVWVGSSRYRIFFEPVAQPGTARIKVSSPLYKEPAYYDIDFFDI